MADKLICSLDAAPDRSDENIEKLLVVAADCRVGNNPCEKVSEDNIRDSL